MATRIYAETLAKQLCLSAASFVEYEFCQSKACPTESQVHSAICRTLRSLHTGTIGAPATPSGWSKAGENAKKIDILLKRKNKSACAIEVKVFVQAITAQMRLDLLQDIVRLRHVEVSSTNARFMIVILKGNWSSICPTDSNKLRWADELKSALGDGTESTSDRRLVYSKADWTQLTERVPALKYIFKKIYATCLASFEIRTHDRKTWGRVILWQVT